MLQKKELSSKEKGMHTIASLVNDLKNLGIQEIDLLTVHTSLRAVGQTENRGEGVIIALKTAVKDGLLLIPTHTWKDIWTERCFDVKNTLPCIGTLPAIAVSLANRAYEAGNGTVRRSLHPTHSLVAFGKRAQAYIRDDETVETVMPPQSGYGKLYTENGKILLIGVGLNRNTFLHSIPERLASEQLEQVELTVVDYERKETKRKMCKTHGDHELFEEYREVLEKAGALRFGKFGNAQAILCDAKICFDTVLAFEQAKRNRK